MTYETVRYSVSDRVGILSLNRPERMNAVIEQLYLDIQAVLQAAETDSEVRVLILTGSVRRTPEGDKQAFCAGADLKEHRKGERSPWQKREYILLAHETTRRLYTFPKPVIVAVNGPARGAGSEMALNGDFLLMADSASIAFPETGLGTFVGGGVTSHLSKLIGRQQAKELIFTGRVLDGPAAAAIGLALKSVPITELLPSALELAANLAEKAPISMKFAKTILNQAEALDLQTTLMLEAEAILACMNTADWREGIAAFAEKRTPKYHGR
ncbi:MAG: enoyl-CoA hydratase/isomerase family protein [Deltaproteobacteria bacterium]|nr:enoyl-CoA hydratase/isomerase family protein [Deltaproteobacteria bacterium]